MTEVFDILAQDSMLRGLGNIPGLYWIIILGSMLASWLVGFQLKRRFKEYSQIGIQMTGKEVAEKMLRESGIEDVKVISVPGTLTDHYNPANKTVNLSEPVYHMNSIAAAAVAAHECGHAVQHAKAYAWLTMRSKLVPVVQVSSGMMPWLLMGGLVMMMMTNNPIVLAIGVAGFALTTLFAFITLPVEFDASKRAMVWMSASGLASSMHQDRAKNALFWAAMTYVVAALASLAQLLYWVMILLNRR